MSKEPLEAYGDKCSSDEAGSMKCVAYQEASRLDK